MKKIERRAVVCLALALLLTLGLGLFLVKFVVHGESWASVGFNRHLYDTDGVLLAGDVLDRDGDPLSFIENGRRTYYADAAVRKATLHVVGDLQGNIGTGVLNAYAGKLTGFNLLNGAFGASRGKELTLTIDARYNYEAYQALNGKSGTVAVYNYKTGEILCLVSAPSYDPLHVPKDLETNEKYQGAYLNRFLSSTFAPGSVYKTVTLAAAIEELPDLFDRSWTCTGSTEIGGDTITCSGVHGEETIGEAFAHSCNVVFAQLAQELGSETMKKYTEKAGLTASYSVNGIPTAKGTFEFDHISDGDLGWSGVGQFHDQVNPCALMVYMGAIANGGRAAKPYLLKKALPFASKTDLLIQPATAEKLADMMAENVAISYGTDRFPHMELCAKSGTAEVGAGEKPHAWFTGFLRNADAPYAFVVLVENGGGGSSVAGSVAGKVLNAMVNGY
ncbi:MAG: penicillin-binding transpeptidase domain-containing protein [Oscillibacter sp.]